MDIIYYIMIYIIGTIFGSFFTLAVYRIPLNKNITYERSFCPECEHKLAFLDLIPVFSYIFGKGRCRYCKQKIRIRYLLLEILSGFSFLTVYIGLNIHFPNFETQKIMYFIFFVFFYTTTVIIAGIDKEYRKVEKKVLSFGLVMQSIYILYLYIVNNISIYRYGMYFVLIIFLFILDNFIKKKIGESKYILQILMFLIYIVLFLGEELLLLSVIIAIGLVMIGNMFLQIRKNFYEKPNILQDNEIPKTRIAFCMSISSVLVAIIETFITYL